MADFLTRLCIFGAAVSFALYVALRYTRQIADFADALAKIRRAHLAAFLAFAIVATLCAQKQGGTNAPPNGASPPQMAGLLSQGGNVALRSLLSDFQFPTNAVRAENWWRRGAWEDVRRVEFPQDWVFPFGEGHLSFADVVSQGSLRRRWTDTNEIASVGTRLALVPFSSTFWHEFTPSNSCRFVWSGALAERGADAPVDAVIELFRDGSASIETNGVAWHIGRPWVYGSTNSIMCRAEAEALADEDWMFVLSADFPTAPPETVCLRVGTNRVAVSSAGECCFALEKGVRHDISLSFVPEGVSFSWYDGVAASGPMRSGLAMERMRAYGSYGPVEFEDPADDGSGLILWNHSLYISPDSADDPTYPMRLLAWMDVPPDRWPAVTWSGDDGEISGSGEWLTLDRRPDSDIIGVTATYGGRTWRGCVVFWNEVEESIVALDGGGILFVESPYTNYPGEVTVQTSTQQKLTAHWALREDGLVTLSATEGAAVTVRADSPDGSLLELPYSWYGCAGDVGSMDIYVTNNDPSRAGDAVEFMIEFDGDYGDYDSDVSGLLEVVRYRVEADVAWPSNKVRHVFGPTETFKAILESGPKFPFKAPLVPGESNMSFDYNGSTCTFPIRVIPPSGETGTLQFYDSDSFSSFIGAGFTANVQVLPTYVSFKDLWIMEGEAGVSGRWGCFENLWKYPESQFAHTPARGALNPLPIGAENKINGDDHARTDLGDLPSDNGGFTLNISLKWGINGGPCIYDAGRVLQTTNVQTDGTVTVSKFGITVRRKPNEDYQ